MGTEIFKIEEEMTEKMKPSTHSTVSTRHIYTVCVCSTHYSHTIYTPSTIYLHLSTDNIYTPYIYTIYTLPVCRCLLWRLRVAGPGQVAEQEVVTMGTSAV